MVLGIAELHRLVKEQNLVENLSQRELENPEGAGFDLRVGEIYTIQGQGFLGVTERETPDMTLAAKYESDEAKTEFVLKPHTYYIVQTVEKVSMPEDLLAIMTPRSTLFRRIVHIMFFEVKGKGNMYRGQWQGGRVTTTERETQV